MGMKTKTSFKKGHKNVYLAKGKNHHQFKHGFASTKARNPLYAMWSRMKRRCYNENATREYPRYGGKGIKVCKRWHEFSLFLEDMGPTYKKGMSIDRIDNSKGYSPENCRWATLLQQQRNKSSVRHYSINGEMLTISEIATLANMKHDTLYRKIRTMETKKVSTLAFLAELLK